MSFTKICIYTYVYCYELTLGSGLEREVSTRHAADQREPPPSARWPALCLVCQLFVDVVNYFLTFSYHSVAITVLSLGQGLVRQRSGFLCCSAYTRLFMSFLPFYSSENRESSLVSLAY